MHYGEPVIRRSVPLALGMLSASNPVLTILDTLSRYSHDNDLQVAINAIFAMGLVGAGTNNARLAQMLRQLASYYAKEPDCLFIVRVSQVSPSPALSVRGMLTRANRDWYIWEKERSESILSTRIVRSCHPSPSLDYSRLSSPSPTRKAVSSFFSLLLECELMRWGVVILDQSHWMLYFIVMAMYPVRYHSVTSSSAAISVEWRD